MIYDERLKDFTDAELEQELLRRKQTLVQWTFYIPMLGMISHGHKSENAAITAAKDVLFERGKLGVGFPYSSQILQDGSTAIMYNDTMVINVYQRGIG